MGRLGAALYPLVQWSLDGKTLGARRATAPLGETQVKTTQPTMQAWQQGAELVPPFLHSCCTENSFFYPLRGFLHDKLDSEARVS